MLVALQILKGQMYDWVVASKQITVVNDLKDKLTALLCRGVPYRLVVAPVFSGPGCRQRRADRRADLCLASFTNSDKHLVDVMARKASKIVQANYDPETGLVRRSGFEYQVRAALQASLKSGAGHALFVINIDRTQVVNDTLGFEAGDLVIRTLAETIRHEVRAVDTVARLGGDEFGVLVTTAPGRRPARRREDRRGDRDSTLAWEGSKIEPTVSIGVAPVSPTTVDANDVIAAAELACGFVKERGGNGINVYRSGDEELVRRKSYMDLVGHIQDTLRADKFELFCQPIVALNPDQHETHGEVLIRMRDEAGEIVAPGLFLPAAERYHLMPAIDRWVVGKTIETLETSVIFGWCPHMVISINLSGQTLSDQGFVDYLHGVLDDSVIPAANLCFEITETTAISDLTQAKRFMAAFKERGLQFSLDDFGTGLSSFAYLKDLDVDFLKIDGSFVKDICTDPIAETMVTAINNVGHTMNLRTIGEFVEDEDIARRLQAIGVDYAQGYGISKPKPFADYLNEVLADQQVRNAG